MSGKKAVVVFHGIGQQTRYSELVKIANEFGDHWGEKWTTVPPSEAPKGAHRGVRFEEKGVDFFEHYWAPLAAGKTSVSKVLGWMGRQTFARFEQMRHAPSWKTLLSVFQTLLALTMAAYAAFVAGNFAALAARVKTPDFGWADTFSWQALYTPEFSAEQAKGAADWLAKAELGSLVGDFVVGCAIAYLALQTIRHLRFVIRFLFGSGEVRPRLVGLIQSVLYGVVFGIALVALVGWQGEAVPFAMAVAIGWGLYRFGKTFLQEHFGDVQVYGSRDEFEGAYAARRDTIDQGYELMRWMLDPVDPKADPGQIKVLGSPGILGPAGESRYTQVVVLAHSLGSVVALDVLRQTYLNLEGKGEAFRMGSIKCFVTAGSPLALFSYIYGRDDPDQNRIDSFFSKDLDQMFATAEGGTPNTRIGEWCNYWFVSDLGATLLEKASAFRKLGSDGRLRDVGLGFGIPYLSHSDYWENDEIKKHVSEKLGVPR